MLAAVNEIENKKAVIIRPVSDMFGASHNPYMFTGRNVDRLDNGSLWLQYNRNRYLKYSIGRWLTKDPLGVVPNAQKPNEFWPIGEYSDGMSLYEYVKSNPIALAPEN